MLNSLRQQKTQRNVKLPPKQSQDLDKQPAYLDLTLVVGRQWHLTI